MSRSALERVEKFMADWFTPDSSARWEMGDGVLTAADLRAVVAMANEAEGLKDALRAIAAGKAWTDTQHPLGECAAMAGRFVEIAKSALAPPRTKPPKPARGKRGRR